MDLLAKHLKLHSTLAEFLLPVVSLVLEYLECAIWDWKLPVGGHYSCIDICHWEQRQDLPTILDFQCQIATQQWMEKEYPDEDHESDVDEESVSFDEQPVRIMVSHCGMIPHSYERKEKTTKK